MLGLTLAPAMAVFSLPSMRLQASLILPGQSARWSWGMRAVWTSAPAAKTPIERRELPTLRVRRLMSISTIVVQRDSGRGVFGGAAFDHLDYVADDPAHVFCRGVCARGEVRGEEDVGHS